MRTPAQNQDGSPWARDPGEQLDRTKEGRPLTAWHWPRAASSAPNPDFLSWHNELVKSQTGEQIGAEVQMCLLEPS